MAGTRRPSRATAKKVKYNEAEDDIELPDIKDGRKDSVPREVINLVTDDEDDGDQRMPTGSVTEPAVLGPIAGRKRKRNHPLKKPAQPKAKLASNNELVVISDDEEDFLRGPAPPAATGLKLDLGQDEGKYNRTSFLHPSL